MPKKKYYYDSEQLTYKPIEFTSRQKLRRFLLGLLGLISVMYIGFLIFSFIVKSPKIVQQHEEIENLKINYKTLSKKVAKANEILKEIADRDDNIYRVYFGVSPISKKLRNSGVGGINRYDRLNQYEYGNLVKTLAQEVDMMSKRLVVQSQSLDTIVSLAKNNSKRLSSIPAIQPVSNNNLKRMASGYGYRMHPIYNVRKFHSGMDFSAPKGTSVYATGDGTVVTTKRSRRGYGKHIKINHGYGYQTVYAHLDKILVYRGKKVKRGDLIGRVGNTGTSTSTHLHYEVLLNKKHVNPVYFYYNDLTPKQYDEMIYMSSLENQSFD